MNIGELLTLKKELRFHNGKFRILVFSDLHGVKNFDRRVVRDINALVQGTKPDLVIFNGDNVWRDGAENATTLRTFMGEVTACLEAAQIPWAHTFGNHDAEGGFPVSEQQKVLERFPCNLTKAGEPHINGTGNCVLPVKSENGEDILYNVWLMDSHRDFPNYLEEHGFSAERRLYMLPDPLHLSATYDAVRFPQIMWYWQASEALEKHLGHKTPGCMVFHMAIPEYQIVYKNVAECKYEGTRRESIGCGPVNTGLFSALFEREEVKTLVCGHDHINDFQGEYLGIMLTMDGGMNYDGYCDDDLRGGRIIDVDARDPWHVKTYMVRSAQFVADYPGTEMRKGVE